MDIKAQRDAENQVFVDDLLRKDPSAKEKLLKLGLIDDSGHATKGVSIPRLEFEAPRIAFRKERLKTFALPLDGGSGGELEKAKQHVVLQDKKISDLKDVTSEQAILLHKCKEVLQKVNKNEEKLQAEDGGRNIVVLNGKALSGKSPECICRMLRDEGFSLPVIAKALYTPGKRGEWSKTAIGKLLFPEAVLNEEKGFRERIDSLLREADQYYDIRIV